MVVICLSLALCSSSGKHFIEQFGLRIGEEWLPHVDVGDKAIKIIANKLKNKG